MHKSRTVVLLLFLLGCSSGTNPGQSLVAAALPSDGTPGLVSSPADPAHLQASAVFAFDPGTEEISLVQGRASEAHFDLAYFWKYYPGMLKFSILEHDPVNHLLKLSITFSNPLSKPLGDVRMILPLLGNLQPETPDGWTLRAGAPLSKPDPYIAFGIELPNRMMHQNEGSTRDIAFRYAQPPGLKTVSFVLDATINANTAEPYAFENPQLTGRFFHVRILDWQEDIGAASLNVRPSGYPDQLRLAPFGDDGEWGTSIPDIKPGHYRFQLTAESPESPGENNEGKPVIAPHWVDIDWPPDGDLVPLPKGQGIFAYTFIDPDTNLPATDPVEFACKFQEDMGGDFIIMEYGEICNSGYLSMNSMTAAYVKLLHQAAPDLPIHLNLDNLGFVPPNQDPCQHQPEDYTDLFFEDLLESIRGQILENPDFDCISGLHFDIEVFPLMYSPEELRAIYRRYASFLGRLHLEPALKGRNITLWEFQQIGDKTPDMLVHLATTDAFMPGCYYTNYNWTWDPSVVSGPFDTLRKMLGIYSSWSHMYGRPYYPSLETFGGWIDGNQDTLGDITVCGDSPAHVIDEWCFGKSAFNTSNEFEVVKDIAVHGMQVEKVVLNLPSGEPIFQSSGLAVYQMGDGVPSTASDDFVYCRTAYAVSRARQITSNMVSGLSPGFTVFRYENDHSWKAASFGHPVPRGAITGCSGRIHFDDHLSIQQHPELWGKIVIQLLDPLTQEIIDSPIYRKSMDIVGVEDGSYLYPDLPRAIVTIQAIAPGWASEQEVVDLRGDFAYESGVDFLMSPQ
jgi:hypothetical protein